VLFDLLTRGVYGCEAVARICRYGLLASVLADRRRDFDQFLIYYNEQENDQGLACWQQASCSLQKAILFSVVLQVLLPEA